VYPPTFDYAAPTTLDEALATKAEHGEDASVLAGGQSLLPAMKQGLSYPELLVDLGRVPELAGIEDTPDGLRIGGMTTHAACERSAAVRGRYPTLGEATPVIADPLVRNRGTVCGSLAHADPAGDLGAVMIALGAGLVARSVRGERVIPAREFFEGPFMTALEDDEILVAADLPAPAPRTGGAYLKLERKVGDFATAAVAIRLALDGSGEVAAVGIGLAAVGPSSLAATEAEASLLGAAPTEEAFREAGARAAEACDPHDDVRGSARYKRAVVETMTVRGLRRALSQALDPELAPA
jgi:aerobic carbon-monoxide dehydrogenase medium subunit